MIIVFCLIFVLLLIWYKKNVFDWRKRGVRGTFPIPILGTSWEFFFKYAFEVDRQNVQKYGMMFIENIPVTGPMLNVADIKLIRQVMIKSFSSCSEKINLPWLPKYIRTSLISISGPTWKRIRSKVTPVFTSGRLRQLGSGLNGPVQRSLDTIAQQVNRQNFTKVDIKNCTNYTSLDIMSSVVFSMQCNSQQQLNEPFIRHVMSLNQITWTQRLILLLVPRYLYRPLKLSAFSVEAVMYFGRFTEKLMEERRRNPTVKYNDFLQLMMNAQEQEDGEEEEKEEEKPPQETEEPGSKHLTAEEIAGQCMFFFMAGVDTIAFTISSTLYKLAEHPRVQSKLYLEILKALPNDDFTIDDLSTCQYLEHVVMEVMRVLPPVTKLFRKTVQPIELENGFKLDKDQTIGIPVYAVHHNPDYYDEPDEFRPERFEYMDNEVKQYAYLPFSVGPMNCAGNRFAMLEIKYYLVRFLKRFEVRHCADGSSRLDFLNISFMLMFNSLHLEVIQRS